MECLCISLLESCTWCYLLLYVRPVPGDTPKVIGVLQQPFKKGIVSFPGLSVGTAAEGYRLRFLLLSPSVGRPIEVFSEPFKVQAAAPAALQFLLQPPPEVAAGDTFQVSVQLLDEHGNPIPHSHTITLSARKETEETEETEAETKGTEETDPETEEASQQIEFLGAAEATAAETQTSSGIATFKEIALPPSKDLLYLKVLLLSLLFLSPLLLSLLLLLFEGPLLNGSTVYLLQTT